MSEEPENPAPPEKCPNCGCKDYEQYNLQYIETTLCEYDVRCKNCKKYLASWGYGHWQY